MCENVLGYGLMLVPLGEVGEVEIAVPFAANTEGASAAAPNAPMDDRVNLRRSIGKIDSFLY